MFIMLFELTTGKDESSWGKTAPFGFLYQVSSTFTTCIYIWKVMSRIDK